MPATVKQIEEILNEIAPFETAEEFDNAGALVGRRDAAVTKVLVALDCTLEVAAEAERLGAELIVTHHPLLFHARKNLLEEDPEGRILCRLIRAQINLISAHTNLDKTFFSGSACCGRLLGLQNLRKGGEYLFLGELPEPMKAKALEEKITETLSFPARCYGKEDTPIKTLAIAGGADDADWALAKELGAQALLTGEVRHHNALAAVMSGFVMFDGGHFGTEAPLVGELCEYLQKRTDDVKYNIRVIPSQRTPFGCV